MTMKKYMVKHLVLCEVNVWRTIEAENYADALAQVAAIEYLTDTSSGADHEVVNDIEVKQVLIKEM
jgi:hypothetical protein